MIKLPYGWDSAVQAAKEANGNGSLNNMQIAASIILELDSQLRSPEKTKTVADAVEQEGEKWTHEIRATGEYCYISEGPNHSGQVFIKTNSGIWDCLYSEQLKPIKPTMTEAQQKMVAKFVARIYTIDTSYNLRDEFDKFCNEYDII